MKKTLGQAVAEIDRLRPNGYSEEEKTQWINALEARIQTEVWLMPTGALTQYDFSADSQTELLLDEAHQDIYPAWLAAQIDFHNGEYDKYQNSIEMYNALWRNYVAWYCNTYRPADGPAAWRGGEAAWTRQYRYSRL